MVTARFLRMNTPSALSPMFQPFRPTGTGWVAYHETEPTTGVHGLAMTWRTPEGSLRWVAALDRATEGRVTYSGRLGEQEDLTGMISTALRGARSPMTEETVFALLFPHSKDEKVRRGFPGVLPSLEDHIDQARRAVREANLAPAMRSAFRACLDHGSTTVHWIEGLRQRTRTPLWPAVTLAASNPALASMVLGPEPSLMTGADPMTAIRHRWPGLSDAHIRCLLGGPDGPAARFTRRPYLNRPHLDLLSDTPVDWCPTSDGAWSSFAVCSQALWAIANACHDGVSIGALAAASKGDWEAFLKRMKRAAGVPRNDNQDFALLRKSQDCRDPVGALANGLILPLMAHLGNDETVALIEDGLASELVPARSSTADIMKLAWATASHLLYGDKSAAAILETSREWHSRQDGMEADIRGDGGDASWPPLFDGTFRAGDISISCIDNYADLRAEGSAGFDDDGEVGLDHCVASRLPVLLSGQSHILSVRRLGADGSHPRLSTCQVGAIETENGNIRIVVEEHRGRDNEDPDPDAEAAVARLGKAFEEGRLVASREALVSHRDGQGLAGHCGYDWRDPGALVNAMQVWRPFLPRWARDLELTELHQVLIEREILKASMNEGLAFAL